MTYNSTSELPETLRTTMPEEAQSVYVQAYNAALLEQTALPQGEQSKEAAAHAVAWQAVEDQFTQKNGVWYRNDANGMTEIESTAETGFMDKVRNLFQ